MRLAMVMCFLVLLSLVGCQEPPMTGQLHVTFTNTDRLSYSSGAKIYAMENTEYALYDNLTIDGRILAKDNLNPGNYILVYWRSLGGGSTASQLQAFQINAGKTTALEIAL